MSIKPHQTHATRSGAYEIRSRATILSLSAPALSFIDDAGHASSMARSMNTYAATLHSTYPRRFGFFATLPSPTTNIDATLAELTHAMDDLCADGVTLLSSYSGRYLGDAVFRPLWAELDRRAAVVLIHPHLDSVNDGAVQNPSIPRPVLDFPHETTRAAVHLLVSNTKRDYPRVKIILSHSGGTLPFMASRIAQSMLGGKDMDEFMREARGFWFDTAVSAYERGTVEFVGRFAELEHVVFGSDFPFVKEVNIEKQLQVVRCGDGVGREEGGGTEIATSDFESIRYKAAEKLFPRFSKDPMNDG